MRTPEIRKEIEQLQLQIEEQEKQLDIALKEDVKYSEAKKIFHSIKLLKEGLHKLLEP